MECFTDSGDITDAFSNHYNELYKSVDYDEDDMDVLYNEVNDGICHCSGNHSHDINPNNIIIIYLIHTHTGIQDIENSQCKRGTKVI